MRAIFIVGAFVCLAASLSAQTITSDPASEDKSGSIVVFDTQLTVTPVAESQPKCFDTESWARRFPDEFDHLGTRRKPQQITPVFYTGEFMQFFHKSDKVQEESDHKELSVGELKDFGHPWWINWPSSDLHNQFRMQGLPEFTDLPQSIKIDNRLR